MSWDDLRILEAVDRLGSARSAGHELGVAASTVYRRLASLESTVGFSCVLPGQGLTPAGRELAKLARGTGDALRALAQRANAERVDVRGVVRLTTIDGFAPLLTPAIADLANRYPNLRIEIHVSDVGLSLRKGQADIGLALLADAPPSLVGRKLFPIRFAVYARSGFPVDPRQARWVVLGPPLEASWLGEWEAKHVPRDRIVAATASRRLLVEMVAGGVGLGLLPAPLAEGRSDLVELEAFRARTNGLTRHAWLLYPETLRRDVRVAAVVGVLVSHLANRDPARTSWA
jgi:DNA-binding transcriptional LysR family regulator